jgi:L-phenylalanine/L-methionine N-acetyltransferase
MNALTIRRAEVEDYLAVARIFSGPKAMSGTLQVPYSSPELWRSRLEGEGMYALLACSEAEIVGQIGLQTFPTLPRRKHVGDIGMAVRDDWQGKGVGSALMGAVIDLADQWLNLSRIELDVFTDNPAAIGLYKKYGFEIEGTKRLYAFRAGSYVDVYAMARLRK